MGGCREVSYYSPIPFSVQVNNDTLRAYMIPPLEDILIEGVQPWESAIIQFHTFSYGKHKATR